MLRDYQKNLERAWDMVEDVDFNLGADAYQIYHDTLRGFATAYGTGFMATVEAFVALSPNSDYHGNLRSLSTCLFAHAAGVDFETLSISTYKGCGRRAMTYLDGTADFLKTVKGKKITCFRDNILHLDKSKRVTIDGHMIAILTGKNMTMKDANFELRKHGYEVLERHVAEFAKYHDLTPSTVQAVLWTSRKRLSGNNFSEQTDLFEGENRWNAVLKPSDYPPYQVMQWREWLKTQARMAGNTMLPPVGDHHANYP